MPGHHSLLCRVHRHDGTATNVSFELSITVQASSSAPDAGGDVASNQGG